MSYTINLTNGQPLIPSPGLSDGTVDNSHSSLTLIGRNFAGYGQFLNENFIYLLENFANTTSPGNPLKGQLWWDTADNVLKVYTGVSWKISTGATAADESDPPGDLSSLGGDLWYDRTNRQLKVSDGAGDWILVGPQGGSEAPNSGAFPALMTDTAGASHIVIQITIAGVIYAIFSKDTFTSSLQGFGTVVAGLNFSSSASPNWGLNTQSLYPNPNTLVVRDSSGAINATTFNGTAITAQYADLAERFASDRAYIPGTVVEIGGPAEIRQVETELSEKVFGVISTNAAYLMNSAAGDNSTHPPIAMSGRVPVRVIGMVCKGDRLVSAGSGRARAGKQSELTPWNVIGRSLVDKLDDSEGIIEAIVKINS